MGIIEIAKRDYHDLKIRIVSYIIPRIKLLHYNMRGYFKMAQCYRSEQPQRYCSVFGGPWTLGWDPFPLEDRMWSKMSSLTESDHRR